MSEVENSSYDMQRIVKLLTHRFVFESMWSHTYEFSFCSAYQHNIYEYFF